MGHETELIEGVRVLGATVDGRHVHVDVYGSDTNICGSVRYEFPDPRHRRATVQVLRRWAGADTVVTMVTSGSTVTMVNEHALLERALPD